MRTLDQIVADAKEKSPFSNGESAEIWTGKWCYQCKVDGAWQRGNGEVCPILNVAFLQKTPKEWTETGLQDYHCSEFVPDDGGEDGDPDPNPQPDQTDMFSVFAEQIAEQPQRQAVSI